MAVAIGLGAVLLATGPALADCEPCLAGGLPVDGATAATNTHFWLQAGANFGLPDDPGYFVSDISVSVGEAVNPEDPNAPASWSFPTLVSSIGSVGACTLAAAVLEWAPSEPLAPETAYWYSGMNYGPSVDGSFTTAAGPDGLTPQFDGIGDVVAERIGCDFGDRVEERIRITAFGDGEAFDGEFNSSTFRLYADHQVIGAAFGPGIAAIVPTLSGTPCFSMHAVDLAGNEDENEHFVCLGPDDIVPGPSYEARENWGYWGWFEVDSDVPDEDEEEATRHRQGCAAVPAGRGDTNRTVWPSFALVAALAAIVARRS